MALGWKIGQQVAVVLSEGYGRDPQVLDATVVKVGRKWTTLQTNHRGYIRDFRVDERGHLDGHGYSSPGMAYESREAYQRRLYARRLVVAMRDRMDWHRLEDVLSIELLEQVAQELGVDVQALRRQHLGEGK